ncbi:2-oxo acid dehydrogenase subunit E2 [Candidatus Karelsulcia muelleri]|uniref:2-oxo acid dehydrogenase subunit E2 n=1 Tax=Candidatus Karelsulcia muelleri TaxID=336810 RepID=UPI00216AFF85|nr:2-oxo acid dehydrogenase subunit E2 [Candidatus Karelsulcia muelleri]
MLLEITIPSPGESITEVEISSWLVKDGDFVKKNQVIAEIDSDKATLEIRAEESGILIIKAKKGEILKVGEILCLIVIDTSKKEPSEKNSTSPSAKKILSQYKIYNKIAPKKHDAIKAIPSMGTKSLINRSFNVKRLSKLRRKLSERLVSVKNETAMLTTFNEVDMSQILFLKRKYKDVFQEKHGVNLGFMPFFVKSCIKALKEYPNIHSMIDRENQINFNYYDVSIAVSGPKGLMVPVIRNADTLSFRGIEKTIKDLSNRIKNSTISIDDMTGGTFTITNGGIFGSMLSTPIINPPQSAILGMHNIVERPVVILGKIEIRPIMYLALSYDHRIIDGKEAVGFLFSIKKSIENPIKTLIGSENELNNYFEL